MAPHCEKSVMVTLFFPENFMFQAAERIHMLFPKNQVESKRDGGFVNICPAALL